MLFVFQLFISAAVIQALYYLVVFRKLAFAKSKHYTPEKFPPVSIVICAKNEAENLLKNLKVILIQHYPKYEVILVNDQSTDNTLDVIAEYCQRNDNIRVFNIKPDVNKPFQGKKFALQIGVQQAKYDTIVVTDADCKPMTIQWLENLVSGYLNETKIVLGYAPFFKENTFLNKFIRFENVMTAMQYLSFAKLGMPYMGVGRNLSFKKNMFDAKVYEKNKDIPSGDDDLFVNAVANSSNTEVSLSKDSFMYSEAKKTWKEWMQQKLRHTRSGRFYKFHHRIALALYPLSNLIFYVTAVILVTQIHLLLPVLLIFFGILFTKKWFINRVNGKLQQSDLNSLTLLFDITYTLYLYLIFLLSLFATKDKWKEI